MAELKEEKAVMLPPLTKYQTPTFNGYQVTKKELIEEFHKLVYHVAWEELISWNRTQWMGFPVYKMPQDLLNLVDVIWRVRPKLIIETGTAEGGSALFMATYLDGIGAGKIVTIDLKPVERTYPAHPRVAYLGGRSSTDPGVVIEVARMVEFYGGPTMVVLDSLHSRDHVFAELTAYADFVSPGSFLIVEDCDVNGHPVLYEHGPGPYEAVEDWLPDHPEFKEDSRIPAYHLFSSHRWFRKQKV